MALVDDLRNDPSTIASIIDHTNVDPTATEADIRQLCQEVIEYRFCSAVVVPYHAKLAAKLLGDRANVVAVIGFPYGIQHTKAKQAEAELKGGLAGAGLQIPSPMIQPPAEPASDAAAESDDAEAKS